MLIQCAKSCYRAQQAAAASAAEVAAVDSFFSLSAKDIDGNVISFESLRGQITLLTNVASYCGFTESHYRGLVDLYGEMANKPVTILAFVRIYEKEKLKKTCDELEMSFFFFYHFQFDLQRGSSFSQACRFVCCF